VTFTDGSVLVLRGAHLAEPQIVDGREEYDACLST
jgi:hypothetical protein